MRKSIITCLLILAVVSPLIAQYKVQFIVKENTAIQHDSIFITGTFNNWDSTANQAFLMKPIGNNQKTITLNLPAGSLRYKFHRGSWFTVEKQYNANEVPDRIVNITKDTTFIDTVAGWRDEVISDKIFALATEQEDSSKVNIMAAIASIYAFFPEYYNADSALMYAQKAIVIQEKMKATVNKTQQGQSSFNFQLMNLQEVIASLLHSLGNYPKSLELRFENLKLAEKEKINWKIIETTWNITLDYAAMKDYENVLLYGKRIDSIANNFNKSDNGYQWAHWTANYIIAEAYHKLNRPDSALFYAGKIKEFQLSHPFNAYTFMENRLQANIYASKNNIDSAFYYYRKTIPIVTDNHTPHVIAMLQADMARLFQKAGQLDSALLYASAALTFFQTDETEVRAWGENNDSYVADISSLLAELYNANGQMDSAYKYLHLSISTRDSLYNIDKIRQFQTLGFNESVNRQQIEQQNKDAQQQYETKIKMYVLISIISGFLILAVILYRNNIQKQKANTLLQSQKEEIEKTLGELKNTQKQLIQSEKMASLGELTAGIAHEIQNPLNFVNNFSEVNTELIEEVHDAVENGNITAVKNILKNIKENEQKINHHGKRADAIVKGMLQHSRTSTGQKEPTKINLLADEYLRLAYHGLRAKDKTFNATLKTDFDETIGTINIIPQDIGRVILNLITNAFYAVDEKKKQHQSAIVGDYEPTVSVTTTKMNGTVEIKVVDNGNGISQITLDKIFQPFFTTKPAGQGTGLGLSLSYDIVKAHGGDLKVETKEGEGSEFHIYLPAN